MELERLQKRANRLTKRNEQRIAAEVVQNYREAYRAVEADLLRLYDRYAVNGVLTHAEMSKYNRLASLHKQIVDELRPTIARNNRLIERLSSIQYEESFYRHAWSIDQAVGVNLKWGMLNPRTIEAATASPLRQLSKRGLARSTWDRVDRAIAQGLVRGTSLPQMSRLVKDAMGTTANDAMRIVRTEAHRARELGNLAVSEKAVEQGVDLVREWVAALDNRTRDHHANLDGTTRAPGKTFPGGAEYPGGFGIASEDINCRCTLIDIIEGLEPELRATREDGVQPYQSFETWAKDHGIKGSRYGQKYNFVKPGRAVRASGAASSDVSLSFATGSKNADKMLGEAFSSAPQDLRRRVASMPQPSAKVYSKGSPSYSREMHGRLDQGRVMLNSDPVYGSPVARHEYGHHLVTDTIYRDRDRARGMMQAIAEDRRAISGKRHAATMERIEEGISAFGPEGSYELHGVRDFFGAVTREKIGGGHGIRYYNRGGALSDVSGTSVWQLDEAFANMTDIYGRTDRAAWEFISENAPKTTSAYLEWLKL